MSQAPPRPKIYHITHVDNLASIVAGGELLSDSKMIARGGPGAGIGIGNIKTRRLALPVRCHPGDAVGDYVPFYFCPRSIMLFVIYKANHPDLGYRGGQEPIVHLEADLLDVVDWANRTSRRWAFTSANAGAAYASFWSSLDRLSELDWDAIRAADFRSADTKEAKQAEFLILGSFPWELISAIGVSSTTIQAKVVGHISQGTHRPRVNVQPGWYY